MYASLISVEFGVGHFELMTIQVINVFINVSDSVPSNSFLFRLRGYYI